jgi:hypothetical protein
MGRICELAEALENAIERHTLATGGHMLTMGQGDTCAERQADKKAQETSRTVARIKEELQKELTQY